LIARPQLQRAARAVVADIIKHTGLTAQVLSYARQLKSSGVASASTLQSLSDADSVAETVSLPPTLRSAWSTGFEVLEWMVQQQQQPLVAAAWIKGNQKSKNSATTSSPTTASSSATATSVIPQTETKDLEQKVPLDTDIATSRDDGQVNTEAAMAIAAFVASQAQFLLKFTVACQFTVADASSESPAAAASSDALPSLLPGLQRVASEMVRSQAHPSGKPLKLTRNLSGRAVPAGAAAVIPMGTALSASNALDAWMNTLSNSTAASPLAPVLSRHRSATRDRSG